MRLSVYDLQQLNWFCCFSSRHHKIIHCWFKVLSVAVTANQTKWDQHDNTTLLDDRVDDITKWRITLERCIRDTDQEIMVCLTCIAFSQYFDKTHKIIKNKFLAWC